ncbi:MULTISPECIES: DUF2474 domain-containing protein [unclassified Acinetobacter]|nr:MULTISPECIES: DUF2474 domain-containing protein [unclassified Acinetobacter]WOE30776.1 DUF2474 domain-containing protein [Acinetobacter sp. SAAs470]WOE38969.1 DUF2474 domain-containing protein [Acinetobacter sp. SAAs474]
MKLNAAGWCIVLWLGGVLSLALIAGLFRLLIQWAY